MNMNEQSAQPVSTPPRAGGQSAVHGDDEIDLLELIGVIWEGKWWIILSVFLFGAGGVAYALMQPHQYQSEALLAPSQEEGGADISGRLGGLASLAGVRMGGGGGQEAKIAMETLKSRAFLIDFIRRHDLLVPLFAVEEYNREDGTWTIDRSRYNPETGQWLGEEESVAPTPWEAYRKLNNMLNVSSTDDGLVRISITHQVPELTRDWVAWLVRDINDYMRDKAVTEAEQTIAYLEAKIDETSAAGMRQVFYQLIEEEMQTMMLANVRGEYVFRTIDPPMMPDMPSAPNRKLIAVLAVVLGGMIGVFAVFVRQMVRSARARSAPVETSSSA
jgi:uncharacterized protein involved in exopolysaccharide biosynthesis